MSPLETSKKQVDYLHVKPLLRVMLSNLPRKNRDIQMYNIYIYIWIYDRRIANPVLVAFLRFFHVVFQSPPRSSTKNT